ncbi:hypothetical protein [Rhodococcus sp. B50]|uniref:hypothetical protein n=1 Tax=Rhodococcus sp. B50 TaxID=2682847 RepID=UPI001BD24100|nr:hypothetical protein [Rhodococcus sp. B50]MBS9373161.1 hypothetical protein [Rhodococcus sp. B50]
MTVAERVRVTGTRFERTLLARPDAEPDTTTRVTWLQGERLYCDLRRPASLPTITAPTLTDMGIDDLVALATQDGFAGRLLDRGDHVEWERVVSFHPLGPTPDAGSLAVLDADTLVEHGVFEDYTEHWSIVDVSPDVEEHLLEDPDTGTTAVLVRVGDTFAFARGRDRTIGSEPLIEQIHGVATLSEARALVDCEISVGHVRDSRWIITASTLPYRVGDALDPTIGDEIRIRDTAFDGTPATRRWCSVDPTQRSTT